MTVDKIVVVTQKTRLEELLERFNTRGQAKFWIEHMGIDFADYDREHEAYRRAVDGVVRALEGLVPRVQAIERAFLPTFVFTARDLVVTVGRDGLVVNAAKYVDACPIVAVNPDPARWDGLLLPFTAATVHRGVRAARQWKELAPALGPCTTLPNGECMQVRRVTMAEVTLNDGQSLLAFNDFLIGRKDQVSARYAVSFQGRREIQSSSGILVSTGVGSTGWLSSTQNMAESVARLMSSRAPQLPRLRLDWADARLAFVVREPYRSRSSGATIGAGFIGAGESLIVESQMPEGGAIFSDGVAEDALAFDSGCVATVSASHRQARLVADPRAAASTA